MADGRSCDRCRRSLVDPVGAGRSSPPTCATLRRTELAQARQHFFLPRRYRDPFGQDAIVDFDANDLLMIETRDALGNRVDGGRQRLPRAAAAPRQRPEPQPDRGRLRHARHGGRHRRDGQAIAGAVEGDSLDRLSSPTSRKPRLDAFFDAADPHAAAPGLLRDATTRIVYDLDRFRRTRQAHPDDPTQWQPPAPRRSPAKPTSSDPLPPQG